MINDTCICMTHVFKDLLFITLLNSLELFKSRKKTQKSVKLNFFPVSQNFFFFNINFCSKFWEPFSSRALGDWPKPRDGLSIYLCFEYI